MLGELGIRHCCSFSVHKRGNGPEEYEDAWAIDASKGRFAVADGATECSFADVWAKQLVDGFMAIDGYVELGPGKTDVWSNWLPQLQTKWAEIVAAKDLPWFGMNKAQKGAHATFLGLAFGSERIAWHCSVWPWNWFRCYTKSTAWRALAVGDACMFIIRDDRCEEKFPVTRAEEFSNSPTLVASLAGYSASLPEAERRREGICRRGDRVLMMTDALAQWFLKELEAEKKPWQQLERHYVPGAAQAEFAAWVEGLRDANEIRNDDVTLVVITF